MIALNSLLWFPVCIINTPALSSFELEEEGITANTLRCYYYIQNKPDLSFHNNHNIVNDKENVVKIVRNTEGRKSGKTLDLEEDSVNVAVCIPQMENQHRYVHSKSNGNDRNGKIIQVDYHNQLDMVIKFLCVPSLKNYKSIRSFELLDYIPDVAEYTGNAAHNLCIKGAIGIIKYYEQKNTKLPKECEMIFSKLMSEAVSYSNYNANIFVTSLLINLGLFKDENNKYLSNEMSEQLMNNLALWLINFNWDKNMSNFRKILGYLQFAFDNVRPNFEVKISKLRSLIEYVLWKQETAS